MRKTKIIIGIHGLSNKPIQRLLQMWWRRAICEGLARINSEMRPLRFELVYWAHFLHEQPLRLKISDQRDPLYIEAPYVRARRVAAVKPPSKLRVKVLDAFEYFMDKFFLNETGIFDFDRVSDYIIRKKFIDLGRYQKNELIQIHHVNHEVRREIREALAQVLRKHRRKQIMLIAHSMGTVIAYDVLTQLVPDVKIHTFVTLGSPLGLPAVMKPIYAEQGRDFKVEKMLPAPENIQKAWFNFSDLRDSVALNYNLSDDFAKNSKGVGPLDFVVNNDYEINRKKNPHKSYGYLRAKEVAEVIHDFLSEKPKSPFQAFKDFLPSFFRTRRHQ